jgi:hypothetical protein
VNRGDPEVRVTELALDDVEWHAFAGHLDRVGVSQLVWCEGSPDAGADGEVA